MSEEKEKVIKKIQAVLIYKSTLMAVSSVNSRIYFGDSTLSFYLQNQENQTQFFLSKVLYHPAKYNVLSSSPSPSDFFLQQEVKIDVPSLECSLENRDESNYVVNEANSVQDDDQTVIYTSEESFGEEKEINSVVDEGKWIKHYHSSHKILLVGEGDFSFSASLAMAFGSASNMIATSLNSRKFLKKNYGNAMVNIKNLTSKGCLVMHGIDVTQIADHNLLGCMAFDRIIFNFPFAGFFKGLSRDEQLRKHRRLVSLFLKNAKKLIDGLGEIHISHKTNGFHKEWNLENIASSHGLRLIEEAKFNRLDYPGYYTKRGFGGNRNFNCNPAKTFKFGLK